MIDRERVIRIASGGPLRVQADELDELCRVYLAWLDAPAGDAFLVSVGRSEDCLSVGTPYLTPDLAKMAGKRVRLVEAK
jgi:hypothetical protein